MSGLVHRILGLSGWVVLLVAGLAVFAEDALALGFVIPGETVALLAGAAAKLGHVSLPGVLVVVIAAAIVGDTVGYEVGRHLGPRALRLSVLQKRRTRVDDARGLLARRGGTAVFLGRWTAFFRAVMPFLAGTARMPYPKFLAWNAIGGLTWGATVVLLGYAAGASYAKVEKSLGRDAALVVLAIVVIVVIIWRIRKRRAERPPTPGSAREPPADEPRSSRPTGDLTGLREGDDTLARLCREQVRRHREHVVEALADLPEVRDWTWEGGAAMTDAGTRGTDAAMTEIPAEECYRLLRTQQVGRLGVNAEHYPLIFPVNYGMDHDTIVIRTSPGTKLTAASHANVTFEVDEIDQVHRSGWSVLVRGLAEEVTDAHGAELVQRTHDVGVRPWAPGEHGHWLRLIPHHVTGRRVVPGELPPAVDPRAYL